MQAIVLYDISHDRTRTKIADTCLDYGLDRTQYSAFIGYLTRTQQRELMLKIKSLLADQTGSVLLLAINGSDWEIRQEIRYEAPGNTISSDDAYTGKPSYDAPF